MFDGDQLVGVRGEEDTLKSGDGKAHEAATEGTDGSDKQQDEDEEQDLEAIAREQAERCVFFESRLRLKFSRQQVGGRSAGNGIIVVNFDFQRATISDDASSAGSRALRITFPARRRAVA